MNWHAIVVADVVKSVDTDLTHGLTAAEARRRLERTGPNRLPAPPPRTWLHRIAAQAREFFVILLTVAALISWLLGQRLDASAIFLIVILNVALGAVQEARAERALAALRNLAAPQAEVVRDGIPLTIPAETLVAGDIVILATGARVPADLRLVAAHTLTVDESLLTGESLAVGKDESPVPADAPLAERHNLVFLGTAVATGRGRGVVIGTGGNTELGALSRAVEAAPPKGTPLAERLGGLGRAVGAVAVGVCVLVFALGVARGRAVFEMFLVATSLAVAAVPEGLPAAVTVALALGVQRMARHRAIVRRLLAVETLGSVTVVCTDKTGTLTLNELAVRRIDVAGYVVDVTGAGYAPIGEFLVAGTPVDAPVLPSLRMLLEAAVLSSDGGVIQEKGRWRPYGDPLEAAFIAAAMKAGLVPSAIRDAAPRVGEVPFTPERKRTLTVHRTPQGLVVYVKGAPEDVLPMCTAWEGPEGPQALDDRAREIILSRGGSMAARGMRVVALARRAAVRIDRGALGSPAMLDAVERDAVLLGLAGLADPVRPEVSAAIAEARRAGVRPVMITGDHPRTALAVAREVGLDDTGSALSGADLDRLSDGELDEMVESCSVFARATPEHKVRILRALKTRGQVVAMTGDGANDAPALAQADVGIAMGRAGTDVAREAADVVLTDDNFATIVAAIREGRTIFENIRKFVLYVLASNVGEVAVVLGATLAAPSAVLTPIQILWINLVTDGLPSAALAVDPPEPGVMVRRPRPVASGPVASGGLAFLVSFGLVIAGACIAAYLWAAGHGEPPAQRRTLVFLTLSLSQLLFAFACRSPHHPALGREFVRNPWLLVSVGLSVVLQLLVVTLPGARVVFSASPLGGGDWAAVAGLSSVPLITSELFKYLRRIWGPQTW
jgi:P-type Ca2+ transporter type 2C